MSALLWAVERDVRRMPGGRIRSNSGGHVAEMTAKEQA
jgi:hypothetical protein